MGTLEHRLAGHEKGEKFATSESSCKYFFVCRGDFKGGKLSNVHMLPTAFFIAYFFASLKKKFLAQFECFQASSNFNTTSYFHKCKIFTRRLFFTKILQFFYSFYILQSLHGGKREIHLQKAGKRARNCRKSCIFPFVSLCSIQLEGNLIL